MQGQLKFRQSEEETEKKETEFANGQEVSYEGR